MATSIYDEFSYDNALFTLSIFIGFLSTAPVEKFRVIVNSEAGETSAKTGVRAGDFYSPRCRSKRENVENVAPEVTKDIFHRTLLLSFSQLRPLYSLLLTGRYRLSCCIMSDHESPDSPRPDQPPSPQPKPQRVLACINCQQRKVKCDRRFPCANCLRLKTTCVPASQTRPRKRRFPERELLDRLRRYEQLLRRNNVAFDPLHKDSETDQDGEEDRADFERPAVANSSVSTPSTSPKCVIPRLFRLDEPHGLIFPCRDLWQAMSHGVSIYPVT